MDIGSKHICRGRFESEPEPVEVGEVEAAAAEIVAMTDGGKAVSSAQTPGSEVADDAEHAFGCADPECKGLNAHDRPVLSFECWEAWVAYDEEERIAETEGQ